MLQSTCPSDKDNGSFRMSVNTSKIFPYLTHTNSKSNTDSSISDQSSSFETNSYRSKKSWCPNFVQKIKEKIFIRTLSPETKILRTMLRKRNSPLSKTLVNKNRAIIKLSPSSMKHCGQNSLNLKNSKEKTKTSLFKLIPSPEVPKLTLSSERTKSNIEQTIKELRLDTESDPNLTILSEEENKLIIPNENKRNKFKQKINELHHTTTNLLHLLSSNKNYFLSKSLNFVNDKVGLLIQDKPSEKNIIKKDYQGLRSFLNKKYYKELLKGINNMKNMISSSFFEKKFSFFQKKSKIKNKIRDAGKQYLINSYYDDEVYKKILFQLDLLDMRNKNLTILEHSYIHSKMESHLFINHKIISSDIPKEKPDTFETFAYRFLTVGYQRNKKKRLCKRGLAERHILKDDDNERRLNVSKDEKYYRYKTFHKKVNVCQKTMFNRGSFKVENFGEIVDKIELHPNRGVQNIHFHVVDQEKEMIKGKTLTKESLIYRTQELKMKMKKQLHTVEEILFFLIKENNFKEFKEILETYRVTPESRDKHGNTFLIFSVECGFIEFVNYLLFKGADINAKNNEGDTPLHKALIFQYFEIVDVLIRNGANEKIVNNINLTPWQCLQYN